jgi:hypothetical protein
LLLVGGSKSLKTGSRLAGNAGGVAVCWHSRGSHGTAAKLEIRANRTSKLLAQLLCRVKTLSKLRA